VLHGVLYPEAHKNGLKKKKKRSRSPHVTTSRHPHPPSSHASLLATAITPRCRQPLLVSLSFPLVHSRSFGIAASCPVVLKELLRTHNLGLTSNATGCIILPTHTCFSIAQTNVIALWALRPPGVQLLLASSSALTSIVGYLHVC